MSDGEPHPTAQTKVLSYTFAPAPGDLVDIRDMSITGSRLVLLRGASEMGTAQAVVWDWTMGQILLVRRLFAYSPTMMRTIRLGAQGQVLPVREVCRRPLARPRSHIVYA